MGSSRSRDIETAKPRDGLVDQGANKRVKIKQPAVLGLENLIADFPSGPIWKHNETRDPPPIERSKG